jgi:tetratricopeptide (TPR) repeat protein
MGAKLRKKSYFCIRNYSLQNMKTIFISILFAISHLAFSQTITYTQWVDRAANFIENNQLDSAAVALRRAMSLEPANAHNSVLLLNLGILQRHLGLYDDAYISFTASMSGNPDSELVLHNRASLLSDMGRFDEAMEDYDAILGFDPQNTEAYYRRGVLFLERNERERAEADFKAAERINPNDFYTKLSKALILKLDDEWEAAEAIYTQLIDSSSTIDVNLFLNRAECFVNTEQFFKAAADLRTIESSQRGNAYFYFLRGRVRLGQHEKIAALNDFRRSRELGYYAEIVDEWIKKAER